MCLVAGLKLPPLCAPPAAPTAPSQFASGGTLKKLIFSQMINPTRKLYGLQDAVRWGTQVAEGLAFLHTHDPMVRRPAQLLCSAAHA